MSHMGLKWSNGKHFLSYQYLDESMSMTLSGICNFDRNVDELDHKYKWQLFNIASISTGPECSIHMDLIAMRKIKVTSHTVS